MIVTLCTERIRTLDDIRAFLGGNEAADITPHDRDEAFGQLSGPATKRIPWRLYHVFGDERFKRLAGIPNGHIYNLRGRRAYRSARTTFRATRGASRCQGRSPPRGRSASPARWGFLPGAVNLAVRGETPVAPRRVFQKAAPLSPRNDEPPPPMPPRKRVYSGIQPTAVMTIGNYFGAVQNWVRLQDECDCVYCVVDLHAMTAAYDPGELRRASTEMFVSLLAAGIDPDRTTVYIQSTVPEQTELCWLLATLTSLGDLTRMTQFKEKSGLLKGGLGEDDGTFISAGLLFYPVLQAADILAYRADCVPVGRDQSQHLELSRGIARRFNSRFGYLFPEPDTLHTPVTKVLSTADPTRKMSKSLGARHYIGLFEEEDSIRRKIRSAVTDSGVAPQAAGSGSEDQEDRRASPGIENLLTLLAACGHEADAQRMREDYFAGTLRYVDLKGQTADALVALTTGMRERRADILRRETDLEGRIMAMGERARAMAGETLALTREKMGTFPPATCIDSIHSHGAAPEPAAGPHQGEAPWTSAE